MHIKKRFFSLKTKIIISTLIPVVISFSLICTVIFTTLFNSLHETAEIELLQISKKYTANFESKINNAVNYLTIIATILELQVETGTADRKMLQKTILNIFNNYELIDGSSIYFEPNVYDGKDSEYIGTDYGTDLSGRISYYFYKDGDETAYLPEAFSNDLEFELPHYTEAKEKNKPIYTKPFIYEVDGKETPMFTLTYPVHNTDNDFIGAVTVDLFLADIYEQLQNEIIYETGYIIITNDMDNILYSPLYEHIGKSRKEAGLIDLLPIEQEKSFFMNSKSILNGKDTLITVDSIYIPLLDSFFYISAEVPLDEVDSVGTHLMLILTIFSLTIIIVITLLLYYLIGRILKPIKNITKSANKIADGDIDETSTFPYENRNLRTIDEIDILSIAIKKMLSQLNEVQELKLEALELNYKKEKAEMQSRAKGDFLAKMSHEIRTPMNAIIGITELVLREEISPVVYEHVRGIKNAGSNLLSIINDILDFSKIESGKLEIISTEYIFASLINDVINITRIRTSEKPIFFIVNLNSIIPNKLIGDEVRIRQVLINLLSNAVKYTHEGFIAMTIDGELQDDNNVLLNIEVADSGIGIKPDDIDKLFKNFIQVDATVNKGVQGTGLGLAITKSLCLAMGGDISVYSDYGSGSTFTIKIPQKFNEYEKFASVSNPSDKKVLLFETREIYADSIACSIDNLGVECVLAHDKETFYNALKNFDFPFIFVSSLLFENAKKIINELGANSSLVLLTEYGEVVAENNIKTIAMPVHSISIANILNDVTDCAGYGGSVDVNITFSAPTARVLIIDDISTNLKVAEGLMAPYNMMIDTCLSGESGIEMIKLIKYDIIFMDHMMPGMDGIEATHLIRAMDGEYYSSVPIIALTANAISGVREMFLQNGMNDFIAKPIETLKLNSVLEQWIPREKKETVSVRKTEKPCVKFKIDGLDVNAGILTTGGNTNHYLTTLSLFYKDSVKKIAQIKECIGETDTRLYITYVHALKSALASIGARKLSEHAKNLESAGINNDRNYIEQNTDSFLFLLNELLNNINKAISEIQKNNTNQIEDKIDKTLLLKLKKSLDEMDGITTDNVIKELQSKNLNNDLRDAIENIYQNILMFEYEDALSIIDELLN